ncbi:sulfatase-like hydrolase/transferase [Phenylobacterium sp.]|uniref:sulfatase-like hydrolase/transferase n=1 Tax=Phenylobacterium sp. TaxID=1871053 RepID=UPI0035B3FCF7
MLRKTLLMMAGALGMGLAGRGMAAEPARQPTNIVVIVADDMGWAENTVAGKGTPMGYPTPNLEKLAKSGVFFDRAYVTASVCAPSRAALLTGRYQNRFGYDHLPGTLDLKLDTLPAEVKDKLGVATSELTLADVLKSEGYRTAAIGKWHLGYQDKFYPTNRGFDEFYGFLGGQTQYIRSSAPGVHLGKAGGPATSRHAEKRFPSTMFMEGPNRTPVDNMDTYLTDDLTNKSVAFIDQNKDKPFFLYLAYNAIHAPFEVTDEYYKRFPNIKNEDERIKAAMTAALDDGIGRVMDELDKKGLRENTMVVFLSDNGCAMYLEGAFCSCLPLRGGKLSEYEGGFRTPMIISWPAGMPKGETYTKRVSALDVFPTAVAASKGKLPSDRDYDGVNLIPYVSGKDSETPHDVLYWERDPYETILAGDWKLWRAKDGSVKMLFNLKDDPNEAHNLYDSRPDKVAELSKRLEAWSATMPPESFPSQATVPANYCGADLHLPV